MYAILPPHLTARLAKRNSKFTRSLATDHAIRIVRQSVPSDAASGVIEVYDNTGSEDLPPKKKAGAKLEEAVRVVHGAKVIEKVLGDQDFPDGVVNFGTEYANAFFDGKYMVFGNGDGEIFGDFTLGLDVFAHEYGHKLIEEMAGLEYMGQPGALNEHVADVMGVAVRSADTGKENWRIGDLLFLDGKSALRDMAEPGTAYNNQDLGEDPQVGHMKNYVDTFLDNGGVHINSGIPNKAFVTFCTDLGVPCHELPLKIWLKALKASGPATDFTLFAGACVTAAGTDHAETMRAAWDAVGVKAAEGIAA